MSWKGKLDRNVPIVDTRQPIVVTPYNIIQAPNNNAKCNFSPYTIQCPPYMFNVLTILSDQKSVGF